MASDGRCTIWLLVASLDERCVSKIGNLFPHVVYIGLWISYHIVPIMATSDYQEIMKACEWTLPTLGRHEVRVVRASQCLSIPQHLEVSEVTQQDFYPAKSF